jgi:hypothetical protein
MIGRRGLAPLAAAVIALSASAVAANAAITPAVAASANHPHAADGRLLPSVALPVNFAPEGIAKGEGSTFYAASLATGDIYQGNLRTSKGFVLVALRAGARVSALKQMCQIICYSSAGGPPVPPMSTIPAQEHL